jgi:FOG: TPR repeat, SEL1 subfamily
LRRACSPTYGFPRNGPLRTCTQACPLTTQDTKTNPDTSLTAPQYAAEGGHPNRLAAQDTKTNPNTSFTALQYDAAGGDPMAEWKLGRMYADGDGVARDDVRAFEYFSRIANAHANDSPSAPQAQIVANAFVALGRYYLNGIPNSKIKPDTDGRGRCFPMPRPISAMPTRSTSWRNSI